MIWPLLAIIAQGIQVSGTGHEICHNAVLGNRGFGIAVFTNAITITENNIFGNGTRANNCGLRNQTGTTLAAIGNFWGAASGPGPDPADAVCDDPPSTTLIDPVAIKPFNIRVRAGR